MEIRLKILTAHVPPFRSLKVIGTDTDRSATCDFILVVHSNYGHISYRFRETGRYLPKNSHPLEFNAPADGALLGIFNDGETLKTRIGAPTRC